ncbi:hypothetical protein [Nitrospira sp. BLG_1]|uniref:hypothetical protein n=1 Tax=Nitrospira sp. BLG_1 TaxID=3395883 RepID=UPI0039BCE7DD
MSILSKEVKRFAEGKGSSVIAWWQFFSLGATQNSPSIDDVMAATTPMPDIPVVYYPWMKSCHQGSDNWVLADSEM